LLTPPEEFPDRHCSPLDGTVCLLGRDSSQWTPELTLRRLLDEQLEHTLNGTGNEDPQGEPAEFWWNLQGLPGSYCLIDSRWEVGQHAGGKLDLHGRFEWKDGRPLVRAAVTNVIDDGGRTIAGWSGTLSQELRGVSAKSITIPWVRVNGPFLPVAGGAQPVLQLSERHPHLLNQRPLQLSLTQSLITFAVLYDSELSIEGEGLAWLFPLIFGSQKRVQRRDNNKPPLIGFVRTYRAGPEDVGWRVPVVQDLREKTIAVFGLGALGGPLAIELARNGCRQLHLIDHDIVEPGNAIRWPLGASAWGKPKAAALAEFMEREYPQSAPVPHEHFIGSCEAFDPAKGDHALLTSILGQADLVVDATASHGVTGILGDYCRAHDVPLISLFALPNLEGGIVARYGTEGGCPTCLEKAWAAQLIEKPRGFGSEEGLHQPPGCAERTFTGASYDLQELSLQAMRLIVETIGNADARGSCVFTLSLADDQGRIPPQWAFKPLARNPECTCNRRS
jgi:hypothetical protein